MDLQELMGKRKKFKAAHPNVHVPDQIGPSGSLGSTASPAAIHAAAAFAPPFPPDTESSLVTDLEAELGRFDPLISAKKDEMHPDVFLGA